jgi:hypothetical protein
MIRHKSWSTWSHTIERSLMSANFRRSNVVENGLSSVRVTRNFGVSLLCDTIHDACSGRTVTREITCSLAKTEL